MKKTLAVLLCLGMICGAAFAEDAVSSATIRMEKLPEVNAQDNGILVVFFSPDDTVRAAAYTIAGALSAGLFEIEPAEPYDIEDLNYMDSQSRSMTEMRDSQSRPEITVLPENLTAYNTIVLCYPIWGGQAPRIIYTFLENTDLSGKTIIPFATSNSSGIGSSDKALRSLTGDTVEWREGKGIKKGTAEEDIRLWAESLNPGE